MSETETVDTDETDTDELTSYIFDTAEIQAYTNEELMGDRPDADLLFQLLGRDLETKVLVQSPELCVYYEKAKPGEHVKPHRHGVHQVNYVLEGELRFGNQRVTKGMGYFTPDMLYSWTAGDEGAEWIEIHSGPADFFTDRR